MKGNTVVSILNLSDSAQSITIDQNRIEGEYTDAFSGEKINLKNGLEIKLEPWGYLVLTK